MIQLNLKTEYSFGRTFASIDRMVDRLKELGCTHAGIVDDSTWGHVPWFKACTKAGIKPLLGVSLIVSDDDTTPTMWFLATDKASLQSLYTFTSKAYTQMIKTSYGTANRLYRSDVEDMPKGIIKFAGDVTDGKWLKKIKAYLDLSPASIIMNQKKKLLAKTHGLKLISTSDNSFVREDDCDTFEMMSKAALKMTPQYILENLEHQTEARKIAKKADKLELPKAPMLKAKGDLEKLCRKGIKFRKMKWNKVYEKRLMYELELIQSKDFSSYFIIVADMVHFAKKHMLVGPSRGSAAGSLVCYLSRITEVDPIPPGLFFERFIDVSRSDLPDIDLDFPDSKRAMVFSYMSEKYGFNNVAHIGTISKFKPRSSLIQVCKKLNIDAKETYAVKVAMIERSVADRRATNCLEDTFDTTRPGQEFIKEYPQARVAMLLEGHASHTGVHAAGLLVCQQEITDYCTVDNKGIAHIEKHAAEDLGLLKIDVLGLRTLGILEDSGIDIDWYNLKFDDPKVFNIFNECLLCGIFQFDGEALRSVARQIKFTTINEIDTVSALARPGPFGGGVTLKYIKRFNGEKYKAMHPLVDEHLKGTFGLPVYQEQTLAIVKNVGQFDWVETSIIRKAVSKTLGKEYFEPFWKKFKKGAMVQGLTEPQAQEIWTMINNMGAWQMNKAHTYSYAVISYWCAYLKAYHPLEFAASNLRHAKDEDNAIMLLREMKREGIDHIPFDIDHSDLDWSIKDGKLYGGFTALKGIGISKGNKMIEARDNGSLTEKQIATLNKAKNPYQNVFPFHTFYQSMYDDPKSHGIASNVSEICDVNIAGEVPHGACHVLLGEVIYKNARNANESVNVKKRDGKLLTGPLEYVDIRLRDDHGVIGARIDRFKFKAIGKDLLENLPVGAHIMIRAKFFNGIPWAFINKWKRIDGE